MNTPALYTKLSSLPAHLRAEVENFIEFLQTKTKQEKIKKKKPKFGCAKGMFKMSADFDAPLDDFKEYMY